MKRTTNNLDPKKLLKDINLVRAAMATENAAMIKVAREAAQFSDGGGLALEVTPSGNARFVHRFRWSGKNKERWLPGDFPETIKLSEARAMRDADRALLRDGKNPLDANRAALAESDAANVPTFAEYAEENRKYLAPAAGQGAKDWFRMMTGKDTTGVTVGALAAMRIDAIELEHVKAEVEPIWLEKPKTAKTLCQRISRVLEHYRTNHRPNDNRRNPADFKTVSDAIGRRLAWKPEPHVALPWQGVPAFLAELAKDGRMSARALEMVILTGCRVSEITEARWSWIDWTARTLTIPAKHMKARIVHVIPLSRGMVRVLRAVIPPNGMSPSAVIFPNRDGNPFDSATIREHVKRIAGDEVTVHGFRSTLSDWGLECPHRAGRVFSENLMDRVIAHQVGNKVSRAYQRTTQFDARRVVMREWSRFCAGTATAKVLPFRLAA